MSAILTMYTLAQKHLSALNSDETTTLVEHARQVGRDYNWSGYCMLYTLMYLEEREIDFDAHGEYTLITPAHRRHLARLDPTGHSAAELDAYLMEDLDDGLDDDETEGWAGEAGMDALRLLHDELARLANDEIILLMIG